MAIVLVGGGSAQTDFPGIKDSRAVVITLQPGDAMGSTPSYKLTITGNRAVQYEGIANVARKGKRTGYISQTAVSQLIQEFRIAQFFALRDYSSAATDMPVCVIAFQAGPVSKEVVDYGMKTISSDTPANFSSGAPESLVYLEKRIDQITGSRRWIKRSFLPKINTR